MEAIGEFVLSLVGKYPLLATVLMVMGGLRVVLKPLMATIQAYVSYTTKTSDDKLVSEIESNKIYKSILFVLDWFASVKVIK